LLIGCTDSGNLTAEPLTSALVLCQLLAAPLFAWFLEWRSVKKDLALPKPQVLATTKQILKAQTRPIRIASSYRRVTEPLLQRS
jgi:hypothetical protein